MKRFLGIVIVGVVFLGGCSPVSRRAGIEVISYPAAKIFIDGKEAGMTPYRNSYVKPGLTEIKLNLEERELVKKVELANNINTVIDWELGESETKSGGYVLSMERTGDNKKAGVIVNAFPDKTMVLIEGENVGLTPLKMDDIGEGERQITLSFPAYKKIDVFVKAIKGYRLLIEAKLAEEETEIKPVVEPTVTLGGEKKIMIKPTETGWLRVRESASNTAKEVAKVMPGETYSVLEENGEWYRIEKGWVSVKYVEKL